MGILSLAAMKKAAGDAGAGFVTRNGGDTSDYLNSALNPGRRDRCRHFIGFTQ
jgi:hypothetical protein